MDELFFIGMDVVEETKNLVNTTLAACTNGMTESELQAYNMGIKNTLSALKGIMSVDTSNEFVINIDGLETPTEFDSDDLMWRLSDLIEQ